MIKMGKAFQRPGRMNAGVRTSQKLDREVRGRQNPGTLRALACSLEARKYPGLITWADRLTKEVVDNP